MPAWFFFTSALADLPPLPRGANPLPALGLSAIGLIGIIVIVLRRRRRSDGPEGYSMGELSRLTLFGLILVVGLGVFVALNASQLNQNNKYKRTLAWMRDIASG